MASSYQHRQQTYDASNGNVMQYLSPLEWRRSLGKEKALLVKMRSATDVHACTVIVLDSRSKLPQVYVVVKLFSAHCASCSV